MWGATALHHKDPTEDFLQSSQEAIPRQTQSLFLGTPRYSPRKDADRKVRTRRNQKRRGIHSYLLVTAFLFNFHCESQWGSLISADVQHSTLRGNQSNARHLLTSWVISYWSSKSSGWVSVTVHGAKARMRTSRWRWLTLKMTGQRGGRWWRRLNGGEKEKRNKMLKNKRTLIVILITDMNQTPHKYLLI